MQPMLSSNGSKDDKIHQAIPNRHTMNGSKLKNVKIFLDTNIRKSDTGKINSGSNSKVRKNDLEM